MIKFYKRISPFLSLILIASLVYFCFFTQDLNKQLANNTNTINELQNEIENQNFEIEIDNITIDKNKQQIDFIDKFVAICPDDGNNLYHKYNCNNYNKSDPFFIYSIPDAQNNGYSPCPNCETQKDLQTIINKMIDIVYITNSGTKYHKDGCSYLKGKKSITRTKAIEQGYTPCSRCNP